jgi:RHS repeat-associated protein
VFTDNPLVPGVTAIKAIHLTELRDAVNQARAQAGLSAAIWTDAPLTGVLVKATHVVELRVRLDEARIALGLSAASYLDPALSAGYTIKALHLQELRARVQETQGGAIINWLVADHLGTPRIIADQSGSLAGIHRHDYLPFGEEIGLIGGRNPGQGYVADNTRQKFTGYEADAETGLNFAQARYQSSVQGRFISVDPLGGSASTLSPQSFNRYSYVENNPLNSTDPTGMMLSAIGVVQRIALGSQPGWRDNHSNSSGMLRSRRSQRAPPFRRPSRRRGMSATAS